MPWIRELQSLTKEPRRAGTTTGPARKKILLVDDSVTTLLLERVILGESPNLTLLTAGDGEEAVKVALREKPDLILMDVVMPRMNGVQACRTIRSSPELNTIPIILVVTRGEDDGVIGGFASGCTAYITKPVNPAELVALVEAHLGDGIKICNPCRK
jgi:DNA-binding response OmpR family regulator